MVKKAKIIQRGDDEQANDMVATHVVTGGYSDATEEGKLAVDVYETTTSIIVIAPVAGVEISDVEVLVEDDVLTICGNRHALVEHIDQDSYLTQECFWGQFSRSIILPPGLNTDDINASFNRGILKVTIAKQGHSSKSIPIDQNS